MAFLGDPSKRVGLPCILSTCLAITACHQGRDDCPEYDLDIGERIRVTVLSEGRLTSGTEQCVPLEPGDQFTRTIWSYEEDDEGCSHPVFAPDVPSFLPEDRVWHCLVGARCFTYRRRTTGEMTNIGGSSVLVLPGVPSVPSVPTDAEYDSTLLVHWTGEAGAADVRCSEEFETRVQFVDRGTGG